MCLLSPVTLGARLGPCRARRAAVSGRVAAVVLICGLSACQGSIPFADHDRYAHFTRDDFREALEPFFAEYNGIRFDGQARAAHHTVLRSIEARRFYVVHTLLDDRGEGTWQIEAEVDLRDEGDPAEPLLRLRRIGP